MKLADDTTVPILAKGKTDTGRIWTYVRMINRSAGRRRRRHSIMPRAIGGKSTPNAISNRSLASCRPMPMAATIRCSRWIAIPVR